MADGDSTVDLKWFVGVGLGIGLLIILFHSVIYLIGEQLPSSPISAEVHLLATSIFASAILTYSLIVLYYLIKDVQSKQVGILKEQSETQSEQTNILSEQNSIQSDQAAILEKQADIIESQNQPRLIINEWGTGVIPEGVPLFGPFTQEQLYFDIVNIGSGTAYDLSLTLIAHPIDEPNEIEENDAKIIINDSEITSPLRRASKGPHSNPHNHLSAGESERFFGNCFYCHDGRVRDAFGLMLGYDSPNHVFIAVKVDFRDEFGNETSIIPLTATYSVKNRKSLDDVLSHEYETWIDIKPSDATPPSNFIQNIDYKYPQPVILHERDEE